MGDSLQDGPQWSLSVGTHTLRSPPPPTLHQNWSVWPVGYDSIDGMSLLRFRLQRLQYLSWALSLLDHVLCRRHSCHVLGALRPPMQRLHGEELSSLANSRQGAFKNHISEPGIKCSNSSQAFKWLQPWLLAWLQPCEEPDHLGKLLLDWDDKCLGLNLLCNNECKWTFWFPSTLKIMST